MKFIVKFIIAGFLVILLAGITCAVQLCPSCESTINQNIELNCSLNCSVNGLVIGASSITIDCGGHAIKGSGLGSGIITSNRYKDYFTIKNCIIDSFYYGIYIDGQCGGWGSDGNVIINNTITNNNQGIRYYTCSSQPANRHDNNKIINNLINGNGYGIYFYYTYGFNLTGNKVCESTIYDIYTPGSTSTQGFENTCNTTYLWNDNGKTGCSYSCVSQSLECICNSCNDCENMLNNLSCTLVKLNNSITNPNGTCISNPQNFSNKIFDCQMYLIEGNKSGYGIYLDGKSNNEIKNCVIKNYTHGIYLNNSENTILENNTLKYNSLGIYSNNSNSTINSNIVCYNAEFDFYSGGWLSSTGAANTCNKYDGWKDDCMIDAGCANTCELICSDNDGDGFNGTAIECPTGTDCNDNNDSINPGAEELCNKIDDNCNNQVDENPLCFCDLNSDGIYTRDHNDLIFAYRCFLGIEKNCNNYFQNWTLIRQEYNCFIGNG